MTYLKATTLDGGSFGNPAVKWRVGEITRDPTTTSRRVLCQEGLLHAATIETETLITWRPDVALWPCRLFRIEPWSEFQEVSVWNGFGWAGARAWRVFGPQGREVAALIERLGGLDTTAAGREVAALIERLRGLDILRCISCGGNARRCASPAAAKAARREHRQAAWSGARDAAQHAVRMAAGGVAPSQAGRALEDFADFAAEAATALVVRDLISDEDYETLTFPWASVMGGAQ